MPHQPAPGVLVAVVYKPDGVESRPADRYARIAVREAVLRAGHGIDGDCKAGRDNRHINLTSVENAEALRAVGFRAGPGETGEQLVVQGIDVAALKPGDRLRLGATACLEVASQRNGCLRFQQVQGRPLKGTQNRLGVMATATAGGVIRVGDPVWVELAVTPARR
ncbi:MAG TPA: MOSC domain-containing protein [Gemmataceae bacterium]|nr:MOSC domain-containing protein [Gemmataceae bacterium]